MENKKELISKQLADNISYYRKKMNLTQLELATKLNYSDKSVSKWERAEGVPDIFVIKELSDFFGVSVDSLISKRTKRFSLFKYRYMLAYFYASIVWLIAGTSFGIMSILNTNYTSWHLLIYAIPASTLVLLFFFFFWRQIKYVVIIFTIFIWSLAFSVTLMINDPANYWIYIIFLPVYLFVLFLLYIIYKPKKIK
ncbi:helix-turn-helix domain-containing protein [Acholeplasma granularum]|uniref:helix-turn-helix domain-containing protein n=1 Tax=Acholeplasma granularum TaxID=264635 RepID=UPI000471059D|nr:helix-turn-helix transcriptional regulator [Acholeplasma granularum]